MSKISAGKYPHISVCSEGKHVHAAPSIPPQGDNIEMQVIFITVKPLV